MLEGSVAPVRAAAPEQQEEVRALLAQLAREGTPVDEGRVDQCLDELDRTGCPWYLEHEVEVGTRIAWRNAVHCVGRSAWRALIVRDARSAWSAEEVFAECVQHLRCAVGHGRVRAVATVLAPDRLDRPGPRVLNSQLVRYAGYRAPDGGVVGDRATVAFTDLALSLGWPGGPGTPFDVLPVVIQVADEPPRWFVLPEDVVLEVPLVHPEFAAFAELGLRWYAHPAISSHRMRLGATTSTVPFSGWYTASEISARNLAGPDRYDLLPAVADRLGLDRRSSRSHWRDRALLELTVAVTHSFHRHGVTIVDHHSVAEAFVRHEVRERAVGRPVHACWRSLVAPMSASTTATFGRTYEERIVLPNFFPADAPSVASR